MFFYLIDNGIELHPYPSLLFQINVKRIQEFLLFLLEPIEYVHSVDRKADIFGLCFVLYLFQRGIFSLGSFAMLF